MQADQSNDKFNDLLDFYDAHEEAELAILMPVPTPEQQVELCRAFDLNPLI